ncbi:hypothetical protein LEP1GSC192_2507 [Leptospira sp. B5-022]|nr:hypothetical protein LEP1GSC192_2507 [Leptospira sp. B5-022]
MPVLFSRRICIFTEFTPYFLLVQEKKYLKYFHNVPKYSLGESFLSKDGKAGTFSLFSRMGSHGGDL